jgi:hypothetical protein
VLGGLELDDPPVLVVDEPLDPELLDPELLDPELDDPELEVLGGLELDDPEPELDVLGWLEDPELLVELPRLNPKYGTTSI